jgi:Asp-tRNA(Asn)/Glu-tRNA(Gln) amidotransferase A subunit family amidase
MRAEAAAVHADRFATNREDYRAGMRSLIEQGLATSSIDYARARQSLRHMRRVLSTKLQNFDALLLPAAPGPAPHGLESTGSSIFCAPASFSGLPAISLPSSLAPNGLPLGVQLVAAPFAEARLLSVAAWAEKALDFYEDPPLAGESQDEPS